MGCCWKCELGSFLGNIAAEAANNQVKEVGESLYQGPLGMPCDPNIAKKHCKYSVTTSTTTEVPLFEIRQKLKKDLQRKSLLQQIEVEEKMIQEKAKPKVPSEEEFEALEKRATSRSGPVGGWFGNYEAEVIEKPIKADIPEEKLANLKWKPVKASGDPQFMRSKKKLFEKKKETEKVEDHKIEKLIENLGSGSSSIFEKNVDLPKLKKLGKRELSSRQGITTSLIKGNFAEPGQLSSATFQRPTILVADAAFTKKIGDFFRTLPGLSVLV
eukprot:GHVP01065063.1.p1 GENE.GHVP01065063.1~~GHVP01065063.1.p1  ORF type:complete len:271 (-),score=62.84 GHVP01065063.1:15-827(-)